MHVEDLKSANIIENEATNAGHTEPRNSPEDKESSEDQSDPENTANHKQTQAQAHQINIKTHTLLQSKEAQYSTIKPINFSEAGNSRCRNGSGELSRIQGDSIGETATQLVKGGEVSVKQIIYTPIKDKILKFEKSPDPDVNKPKLVGKELSQSKQKPS